MKHADGIEGALQQLRVTTTITLDTRILDDAFVALDEVVAGGEQRTVGLWQDMMARRFVRVAAVIALIAAVAAVALVLWMRGAEDARLVVEEPSPAPDVERLLARERAEVKAMFAAGDIDGLIEMLEKGQPQSRLLAASCLGQIGDTRAIGALSQLAAQWPVDADRNPYREAIEQINARILPPEPNAPDPNRTPRSQVIPEAKPAPTLSGTITDSGTSEPLKGVLVQVSPSGGGRVYEATSDSNGVYTFGTVGGDGAYYIRLTAPEHVTPADWQRPRETIELRRGGRAVKDYSLARGAEIVATVVDQAGKPVRGVRIYAAHVADDMGRGPKDPVRTAADGVVSLGGLPTDKYMVTAAHRDYASAGQTIVLEEPGQVKPVVFVLETGMNVAGVATCSDGLPASGWQIEAKPIWWHSVYCAWDYPIAEDGSFVLQHVLPGQYQLGIQIPVDGGAHGVCSIDVNLPPETGSLDLRIPRPSPHGRVRVTGIITFTGGEYDGGFWIHARSDAGHFGSQYLERGERAFVLDDLVPGLYDIDITIAGDRHEFKNVPAPSEGITLEIPIHQAVTLRAIVVDKQTSQRVTRFQFRPLGERDWRQVDDANGTFEITTRGPDVVKVMVEADGYGDKLAELSPDANEPTLVEMTAPVALAGTVVDEGGRAIEGASVSYRYRRTADEPSGGKCITTTDIEGRFLVDDVPPHKEYHWFVFRHPDFARDMKYFRVGDDATKPKIVMKKGGTVEGYVYDWRGELMPHTRLYFMDESQFSYWRQNRARLGEVTTDESGYYRIEHLPEELCYAFREGAHKEPGVVLASILPRQGQTLRLDLGGRWKMTGRLLKDGQPLANTHLMVFYEAGIAQGFEAHTITNALGEFAFYGMPTGRRCLYGGGGGPYSWAKGWLKIGAYDLTEGLDMDLGDCVVTVAQVTIELVPEGPDMPMDSWHVRLQEYDDDDFRGREVGQLEPRRDHGDPFVYSGLAAGRYEAIAQKEGYPSVRQVFEIDPETSAHALVLTVPSGSGALSGILEPASADQSPSPLMLRGQDQRITAELRPASDGTFTIGNLPAGQYVIGRASVAKARTSTLATVELKPGEHKDIRLQLDSHDTGHDAGDGYLVVLVVTEAGLPLATPDVWLEHARNVIEPHFNTDDGKSFRAEPGTYTLHVQYPGLRPVRQTVEIQPRQGRTVQEILEPLVVTMRRR